ncbi:TIGR02391 family protein [Salinisphaera sp. LB1]|uniref:TIGR02391 family protein n=1 Tax=Salinisphaera sp. LB1 TaxID=2183911 RepID=UPI000FF3B550|nr:TIGR02391 family protein [Salinisphaera sp. LB1]
MRVNVEELASIEYHGSSGSTQSCLKALARLFHYSNKVRFAYLITQADHHGFLLNVNESEQIAIAVGFRSGYSGEGPRGLVSAFRLFEFFGIDIEEVEVSSEIMMRFEHCALKYEDVSWIESAHPVRPARIYDYILSIQGDYEEFPIEFSRLFPAYFSLAGVDERIRDLALRFSDDPDGALIEGYRRLEQCVKARIGEKEKTGAKLFSTAFQGDRSTLYWSDELPDAEHVARAKLFEAVFGTYRNPRMHCSQSTIDGPSPEDAAEFLALNELFLLEAAAILRPGCE